MKKSNFLAKNAILSAWTDTKPEETGRKFFIWMFYGIKTHACAVSFQREYFPSFFRWCNAPWNIRDYKAKILCWRPKSTKIRGKTASNSLELHLTHITCVFLPFQKIVGLDKSTYGAISCMNQQIVCKWQRCEFLTKKCIFEDILSIWKRERQYLAAAQKSSWDSFVLYFNLSARFSETMRF